MKAVIEVEITNIKVDEKYYSFDYAVTMDGSFKKKDTYSSDHGWMLSYKSFEKILYEGEAVSTALQQTF